MALKPEPTKREGLTREQNEEADQIQNSGARDSYIHGARIDNKLKSGELKTDPRRHA